MVEGTSVAAQHTKRTAGKTEPKRRDEVIEAALRVFSAKGYAGASVQDIADELGILKGSVYHYISSKEDILYEVMLATHRLGLEAALSAVAIDGPPIAKIRSLISSMARFNATHPARTAILNRELRSLPPRRRREIIAGRDRYEELLQELIAEGQGDGSVSASLDVRVTTLALMSMINGIQLWYRPSGGMSAEKIGEMHGDLAVRTVTACPLDH
jgi:AcrR family transcriptional regulator